MSTEAQNNPTAPQFTLRQFREEDIAALTELYTAHDLEFLGSSNMTEEMMREEWRVTSQYDPITWSIIAEAADGSVVGLAKVMPTMAIPVRPFSWILARKGWDAIVDSPLIEWCINKSRDVFPRVPDNARIVLQGSVNHKNTRMTAYYDQHGFATNRGFYTMLIRFDGVEPAAPVLPEGIRLVTFAEYPKVEAFAHALRAGFADHRGATESTPEYYVERVETDIKDPHFDPTTWWLALDENDNPAAVCNAWPESEEYPNTAYIAQLAVLPDYRRKGLAVALLHNCFLDQFKRGKAGVSLGVDSISLTNAVAMYERAGMHVDAQWDVYELEIRPGEEITKQ